MTHQLTESDRATVQRNIDLVDRMGDLVGAWGFNSTQLRQRSFTVTVDIDNRVDVFALQEFVNMLEEAPAILGPYMRRILEIDDELKAALAQLSKEQGE